MNLKTFFVENPSAALAFSGGTDSSYLLYAAKHYGCDIHAYFIHSAFQPQFELDDAKRLADELGVPFTVAEIDVLKDPQVAANGPLRCYYCKTALFTRLRELAQKDGYPLLIDGTNASDLADDRPGMRALKELGVRSPLRECGLTKPEIRRLSKEAGLFTHDKPAYACLATRIPTGTGITPELLKKAEQAEAALFSMGFTDFRVRYFHGAAKLQLPESQFSMALSKKDELTRELSRWFDGVLLDLTPRG
ncbi:MAG: ATP-dependent sacrificial sulfur transferase LarE [Clostridiales bacterium]|jgi:pyridinium-3,5-biscarboxylic acid mononucleotide sulfurtransferase|nr:ATP-dependent sacrificial sulfur transferase LarE [Clostridiales bacterium]